MKNLILLIAVIIVSACASVPTVESMAGTYEGKKDGDTYRTVLLENGVSEYYENGKKVEEGKWSISKEGEMHIIDDVGDILVLSINKDESITYIAEIKGEKREDYPAWVKIPAHPLAETMKKIK